ncbi:MAG: hypothetical protein ABII02_00435 [Candidatus Magasanikbacteria bacterium]
MDLRKNIVIMAKHATAECRVRKKWGFVTTRVRIMKALRPFMGGSACFLGLVRELYEIVRSADGLLYGVFSPEKTQPIRVIELFHILAEQPELYPEDKILVAVCHSA